MATGGGRHAIRDWPGPAAAAAARLPPGRAERAAESSEGRVTGRMGAADWTDETMAFIAARCSTIDGGLTAATAPAAP